MLGNAWPQHAMAHKNASAGVLAQGGGYLDLVTWTQANPVYDHNPAQEVSSDIGVLKKWAEREADLTKIRSLQADWDGYGSMPPQLGVWNRAVIFLYVMHNSDPMNPPRKIAVSPEGLIALEWLDGRTLIRAEVGESDEVEWMIAVPGHPAEFVVEKIAELAASPEQVHEWKPTTVAGELAYASER